MRNYTFYVYVASEIRRRRIFLDTNLPKTLQIIEVMFPIAFDPAAGAFPFAMPYKTKNKLWK